MTDSFVIIDVPPPNFVIVEQPTPNVVIVEEGGSGGTAGVISFDGRSGIVGFTLADAERIFTADGQLLIGTGTGTASLLSAGTNGYVLTMVSGAPAWAAGGGGGGGSFPDSTGSGSPEGVVTGNWGDTYQDTSSGGLYFFNGTNGDNTGWAIGTGHGNGLLTGSTSAGVGFSAFGQTATLMLISNPGESVLITDTYGAQASTNGIWVDSSSADYLQQVRVQTGGPSTFNTWHFNADGSTVVPTYLTLNDNNFPANFYTSSGSPIGVVSATETGDVCIDTVTPALYQATSSGDSSWVQLGSGGGGSFPDFTGSGSPEGIVAGNAGDTYEDTDTGGLYFAGIGGGSTTGWRAGVGPSVGIWDSPITAGIGFNGTGSEDQYLVIAATPDSGVILTDTYGAAGSFNGLSLSSGTGDYQQEVEIQLGGPSTYYGWQFLDTGQSIFPGPIILDATVDGGAATLFAYHGVPTGVVVASQGGDICVDTYTPALWQSTAIGDSSWVNITGGGGGGSFPTFTGSGSPEGVQTGSPGDVYQDTGTGALYFKQGASSDTGWTMGISRSADLSGAPYEGIGINPSTGAMYTVAASGGQSIITDADAYIGSGNGLAWVSDGIDGDQYVALNLGTSGEWLWEFNADGSTNFPGEIVFPAGGGNFLIVSAYDGNPNSHVTAAEAGDIVFDQSTPAIWQATASGMSSWVQLGSGDDAFPDLIGSGSPIGVESGSIGQWYEDTSGSTSGIYVRSSEPSMSNAVLVAEQKPTLPLTVVTGTNDTFIYTPIATGIPEDFVMAAGTYSNLDDLCTAVEAAIGSLTSEAFSTIISAEVDIFAAAQCTAASPAAVPLTVTTGTNDTFIYTPIATGSPETFTVAAGTYSTFGDLFTAVSAAVGSVSGEPFSTDLSVGSDGSTFVIEEYIPGVSQNGDTLTTGPTDILASLGFSSPATFEGGEDSPIALGENVSGSALNGDTIGPGANDVSVALGFTGNPDTFTGGYGSTLDGWMQVGGQTSGTPAFGLSSIEAGQVSLLQNGGQYVLISDVPAVSAHGSGNGVTWQGPDYGQTFSVVINGYNGEGAAQFDMGVANGVGYVVFGSSIATPVLTTTGSYAMTGNESVVIADGAVTLPAPNRNPNAQYYIKDSGAGTMTLLPNGSETIDGASSYTPSNPYFGVLVTNDDIDWWIISAAT